jgi:hypothetical protein
MKVRVCPECGKQNDENAWNCANCGATLSMNTLMDSDDIQTSPVAGKGILSSVSEYFQEDLTYSIKKHLQGDEVVVHGCDVCKPSEKPPFSFGYLILTSKQLICVQFESETEEHLIKGTVPKRAHSYFTGRGGGRHHGRVIYVWLVNRPSYSLTSKEKSSRRIATISLKDLKSIALMELRVTMQLNEADAIGGDIFHQLNLSFAQENDTTLTDFSMTFYFPDEALRVQNLLTPWLPKK